VVEDEEVVRSLERSLILSAARCGQPSS